MEASLPSLSLSPSYPNLVCVVYRSRSIGRKHHRSTTRDDLARGTTCSERERSYLIRTRTGIRQFLHRQDQREGEETSGDRTG